MTMPVSRVQLLRMCARLGHRIIGPSRTCSSQSNDGKNGANDREVDVTEMHSLKDFVNDAIVRGSSLLLSPTPDSSNIADTDCTDIHQRHYIPMHELKRKELNHALKLFDESKDVDDFVQKYRSSPSLAVAGIIAPPEQLYYTASKVKDLMATGLDPIAALVALNRYSREVLLQRVPILQEVIGEERTSAIIRSSQFRQVVKSSLLQARNLNLLPEDKDMIQTLVQQLPLSEFFKSKLIRKTRQECSDNLNAMSVSQVKIAILNEYLRLVFPSGGYNPVTPDEMEKMERFRLKDAIEIVDIIRNDPDCVSNLGRINFRAIVLLFSPDELRKLFKELPKMGPVHVSSVFFMPSYSLVFRHGVDFFIKRYHFLRSEGFSDAELVNNVDVFKMNEDTLRQRLEYWYQAIGKKSVVMSHKGLRLLQRHQQATYIFEVTNGKKAAPVHYLLSEQKPRHRDPVITGYLQSFCNKFDFERQPFIEKFFSCPFFKPQEFDLGNMYRVYQFLEEQTVTREQLANSPYIMLIKLNHVEHEFQAFRQQADEFEKWVRHPLFLDLIVYRVTAREKCVRKNQKILSPKAENLRRLEKVAKLLPSTEGPQTSSVEDSLDDSRELEAVSENPDDDDDCRKGYAM